MSDDDYSNKVPALRPHNVVRPTADSADLPALGGVVNRWLDKYRALDNRARTELINSIAERFDAQGRLIDAYIGFERKKQMLYHLDDILDDEDDEIRLELEEKAHAREMRREQMRREKEGLNPAPEPERAPRRKKPRNRKPQKTESERLWDEAQMVAEHGTTEERGAIAKEVLNDMVEKYGEDQEQWPHDIRENARKLRLWAMQNQ